MSNSNDIEQLKAEIIAELREEIAETDNLLSDLRMEKMDEDDPFYIYALENRAYALRRELSKMLMENPQIE